MSGPECRCAETYYTRLDGVPARVLHPWHSCRYVAARNSLIPAAMAAAQSREAGGRAVMDGRRFIEEMDRRWHEGRAAVPREAR